MSINLFTNEPKFCQKELSVEGVLDLPKVNMNLAGSADPNNFGLCGDPNLGTLMIKNLVHKYIRCGGAPIDLNLMQEMFPNQGKTMVSTKEWYNHHICDQDLNIYFSASVTGNAPGDPVWATLLKSNHGQSGAYSLPQLGYQVVDKEDQRWYTVTDVDTTTPYAHRFELTPNDGGVAQIRQNRAYVVGTARLVGGCQCPEVANAMSSIGYSQVVHPIRVRKDWRLCVDLLTGYRDKFQFAIIYDINGNPVDAWDIYEAQKMREGIRATLNLLAFIGTPVTNPSLVSGAGATVDGNHTGFYGFIPTLRYGGGNVYNYNPANGFDLEADFEPIALYQDSRKRSKRFMVMHGLKFAFNLVDRTNKLVSNTDVGAEVWEAFRRLGDAAENNDYRTAMSKLGIRGYNYMGFGFDMKKMDSWSDYRFVGNDTFNNMAIFLAEDGTSENGRPLQPVEFYTYGQGQWTGNYEEHYIDYRKTDGCNDIGGWAAESLAMAVHCPDQHVLVYPIKSA